MSTISLSLSTRSIEQAIKEIELYKSRLSNVAHNIVYSLLQVGIRAGEQNTGEYKGYITFDTTVEKKGIGHIGLLIARDRQKIVRRWLYKGEWVYAEVSPLLMSEFGSGQMSMVLWGAVVGEVGQGTFPGQRHAYDIDGWHWTDDTGYHHSYGESPTFPMHSAWLDMYDAVNKIAQQEYDFIFG